MRKPGYAICEQQRRRSLPRFCNISSFYIQNSKPLASFCGWAGQFETYLIKNPENRFSGDEAQIRPLIIKPHSDPRLQ